MISAFSTRDRLCSHKEQGNTRDLTDNIRRVGSGSNDHLRVKHRLLRIKWRIAERSEVHKVGPNVSNWLHVRESLFIKVLACLSDITFGGLLQIILKPERRFYHGGLRMLGGLCFL